MGSEAERAKRTVRALTRSGDQGRFDRGGPDTVPVMRPWPCSPNRRSISVSYSVVPILCRDTHCYSSRLSRPCTTSLGRWCQTLFRDRARSRIKDRFSLFFCSYWKHSICAARDQRRPSCGGVDMFALAHGSKAMRRFLRGRGAALDSLVRQPRQTPLRRRCISARSTCPGRIMKHCR